MHVPDYRGVRRLDEEKRIQQFKSTYFLPQFVHPKIKVVFSSSLKNRYCITKLAI